MKSANHIKRLLSETSFLDKEPPYDRYGKIVSNGSKWRLHWVAGVLGFFPFGRKFVYCPDWTDPVHSYSFQRNAMLSHPNIEVDADCNEGIYWNWRNRFRYNDNSYEWVYDNNVYLLNQTGEYKKRDTIHKNEDNDEYFCIHMNNFPDITQQGFLKRLTNLANEALS